MLRSRIYEGAQNLHGYLVREHLDGGVLRGPDPGIRFNARIGRFLKSYVPQLSWSDSLVYMQAQGYWVLTNWILYESEEAHSYADLAIECSQSIISRQAPDGYWDYPNPEWKGRIATVEGCFASLALLATYSHTGDDYFLEGALRWHDYVESDVGFRKNPKGTAVNYFAHASTTNDGGVPNNSTLYCWFLAELANATDDEGYLTRAASLVEWLADVQLPTGELPYLVGESGKTHFLCYQYNAFEFMDLVHYRELTGDQAVDPILKPLAQYLSEGVRSDGSARYSCVTDDPRVTYYAAALAQALSQADALGLGDYRHLVDAACGWVLDRQRSDGGLRFHSANDYRYFSDRRSYPRYLSMVMHHLVLEWEKRRTHSESV